MGMLSNFTKAKLFGASNDSAMKYALVKSVFSSDSSNKNNCEQRNNNNNSYSYNKNDNFSTNHEVNIPKLSLTDNEKKELQQTVLFDDSNIPLYFTNINAIKRNAKHQFEQGIGIYDKYYCIVKINQTQKNYLEKFFNKLLLCDRNFEIKETIKLYITNTGLQYLNYFINFSTDEKMSIIKTTIKQNLSLRINIINNSINDELFELTQIDKNKRNNLKEYSAAKKDINVIRLEDVEITFPFIISEMEYLSSGWIWHKADKEQAEIWKDRYPEKMDKYIGDFKYYKENILKHWKVIKLNFDYLYNNLKEKIENLSDNQKIVLNNYLESIENCKELGDLFKLQHEVYYDDGFLWLPKIIPYNDTSEPELSIRKSAFKKYKSILDNKDKDVFFSLP